jgi:hypothetical protein
MPRRPFAAAALAALALAAAGCGGADTPGDTRISTGGVSFDVPPTWELVNPQTLALIEGDPAVAVRRKDGSAILTMTRAGKLPADVGAAGIALRARLQRSVPDLRGVRGTKFTTRAGSAFSFLLVRDMPEGPARVVEVPSGDGSWMLELSLTARAATAAEEVDRILRSFDD